MNEFFYLKINKDIRLERPTLEMAEAAFQAIKENETHIGEFLEFVLSIQNIEVEKEFIQKKLTEMKQGGAFLTFILDNEKVIGSINLHAIDQKSKKAEMGYWLAESYTRRGLMKNIVKEFTNYSFSKLGLNKLIIKADTRNIGSIAVAKSCGFRHVGVLKEDLYFYEKFEDMNLYELIRKDWQKL